MFEWLFGKKKEIVEVKPPKKLKPTKKIAYRPESYDIGYTNIQLEFSDGRTFVTKVYGETDQSIEYGGIGYNGTYLEPRVGTFNINNSLAMARHFVQMLRGDESNYVDDPSSIQNSVVGKVISAKILDTKPFASQVRVAFLEDIKDETNE